MWCRYITSSPLQGNVHLWYYTGNTLKELRIDIRVPPETLTMHRGTCYVMKWDQVVVLRHNTLDLVEHSILLYFFSGLILNILQNIHILAISQSFQVGLVWYQKQMRNPHNEAPCGKKFAKILKIGRVIAIFVRLTKIQRRVDKNQENEFFGHF